MTDPDTATPTTPQPAGREQWLTRGTAGIGTASLLADVGHEIPTSLLPSLLISTLHGSASALGVIEGVADALAGAAKLGGGALADDPHRRRRVAIGGYSLTAVLSSLIGVATSVWQVAILRAGAWTARGLRVPARNALLADIVPPAVYGRAYGFERAMDNLGAILGPLLGILLVTLTGVRGAILISVIPGLLAGVAILYAIRHTPQPERREHQPIRLHVRSVLTGPMRTLMVGIGAFELGNMASTLLILRATELLTPGHGKTAAVQLALALYTAYNIAATLISIPAGGIGDRHGSPRILLAATAAFLTSYVVLAVTGPSLLLLAIGFVLAGIAIGCGETAETTAIAVLAPDDVRGSAFGLLAATQSVGNLVASVTAGSLWTAISPAAAFLFAAGRDAARARRIRARRPRAPLAQREHPPVTRFALQPLKAHRSRRPTRFFACCPP